MRTAPVALAYLDDEDAMVEAARTISELTHFDPDAGDACVLWCCAIRHAVLTGELDVRVGLRHLEPAAASCGRSVWTPPNLRRPASFPNNGWVVTALQAAWSAITTTPVPVDDPAAGVFGPTTFGWPSTPRSGRGTTPTQWRRSRVDCWVRRTARPRCRSVGARCCTAGQASTHTVWSALATAIERKGKPDGFDFSYPGSPIDTFARHPYDDGVLLGGIGVLRSCRRKSTRSCRCAGSRTRTCATTCPTWKCG